MSFLSGLRLKRIPTESQVHHVLPRIHLERRLSLEARIHQDKQLRDNHEGDK